MINLIAIRETQKGTLGMASMRLSLNMSDVFFKNFNLPEPHIHLGVGSGTHARQTGNVMIAYEQVLMAERPDCSRTCPPPCRTLF